MNIEEILNKNKQLENEVNELKEKLKKYTAPSRSKTYYENIKFNGIGYESEGDENGNSR